MGVLIGGMIAAFFSLGGWWDVSKLAGEVRDPGRNLPRALLLGVTIVTFVYVLISLVFLYLVPTGRIDSRELTRDAAKISPLDHERLSAVGFDDQARLQITLIASWFNYVNRVADSLGIGRD
ncbi:MAG: amino acid permease [Isosphaeraceae bacterium]